MKLIDKSALVAEMEKHKKEWQYGSSIEAKYKKEECDDILSFLGTLEVKEANNIWHDASEELPVTHRRVLLYTEEGTVMQGMHDGGSWVLDMWVPKFPKILKWCYLSDVLPSETTKD